MPLVRMAGILCRNFHCHLRLLYRYFLVSHFFPLLVHELVEDEVNWEQEHVD